MAPFGTATFPANPRLPKRSLHVKVGKITHSGFSSPANAGSPIQPSASDVSVIRAVRGKVRVEPARRCRVRLAPASGKEAFEPRGTRIPRTRGSTYVTLRCHGRRRHNACVRGIRSSRAPALPRTIAVYGCMPPRIARSQPVSSQIAGEGDPVRIQ
jgi:hypothetical protein